MSVPKGRRTISEVSYFSFAYRVTEKVIKYILSDFGTTKTYRDLHVFTNKAKMSHEDKELFEELASKYKLDVETSYPEYIFSYFRRSILSSCRELINLISKAHTMYPNSMYEYNVRRQYQTDAISTCYDMKHMIQIAIKIFNSNNLEKFIYIINDIDTEIEYLKNWRKDCNKFKNACYANDERNRINALKKAEKQVDRQREADAVFLARVLNVKQLNRKVLLQNINTAVCTYDQYGRPMSSIPIPAITYMADDNKTVKGIGL